MVLAKNSPFLEDEQYMENVFHAELVRGRVPFVYRY
jgi:hypothetical protein